MKKSSTFITVLFAYVSVSLVTLLAGFIPNVGQSLRAVWPLIWLIGPPGLLIYHSSLYTFLYIAGSVLVIPTSISAANRSGAERFMWMTLGLWVWFSFGMAMYLPWF